MPRHLGTTSELLGAATEAVRLSQLTDAQLSRQLKVGGLVLQTGPFKCRIVSDIASVAEGLKILYADYPIGDSDVDFCDIGATVERGAGVHRFWRQQARFQTNGEYPYEPLPIEQAYPQLEWGLNWCIATQVHHYLTLHSAVIERDGFAAILPAPPGSGKSTLCAALIHRGWRLLSDEFGLVALTPDRLITPLVRAVSLKNRSIDVIRAYVDGAVFNRTTHHTSKGSVTHMKVPADHVRRANDKAVPRWVVFPKYEVGSKAVITPRGKADTLLALTQNSFNYNAVGQPAYEAVADLVAMTEGFDFRYGELDDAVAVFDGLASGLYSNQVQRAN